MRPAQPHEKRVQRVAYLALVLAAGLAVALATQAEARVLGVEVPTLWPLLLAVAGLALGAFAAHRRSGTLALAACGLLVLAVAPAGDADPGLALYGLGLLFGLALLAYGELVHMTTRHERASAAVAREGAGQGHMDRVGAEAMRTLAARGLLGAGLAALGVLLAYLLSVAGPLRLRAAVETTAPLGVAVASLALMGGAGLFILIRGALARRDEPQESASDAAD